jgi:hypothetical protein
MTPKVWYSTATSNRAKWKILVIAGLASSLQVRRVGVTLGNLHHVGAAVAGRELHHAEPVAVRVQPHGLGVDRHRAGVAGQVGQIAAMQAYGHACQNLGWNWSVGIIG